MYGRRSFGDEHRVRCPEFGGGRFSEVANVLYIWDFRSVTSSLSALGSVSASRTVRSERFNCIHGQITVTNNEATEVGGGIHLYHSDLVCKNGSTLTFQKNAGNGKAGGMIAIGSNIKIRVEDYRRNWLLSACAYSSRRQETMCLIKSMRLTGSVRLGIEGGASP